MVGGLAANVSTVILVGAALAFMHVAASPQANDSAILIVALVILVVGLALIVVGTFPQGDIWLVELVANCDGLAVRSVGSADLGWPGRWGE